MTATNQISRPNFQRQNWSHFETVGSKAWVGGEFKQKLIQRFKQLRYIARVDGKWLQREIESHLTDRLRVGGEKSHRVVLHPEIPERQDAVGAAGAQDMRLDGVPGDASQTNLDQGEMKAFFSRSRKF